VLSPQFGMLRSSILRLSAFLMTAVLQHRAALRDRSSVGAPMNRGQRELGGAINRLPDRDERS